MPLLARRAIALIVCALCAALTSCKPHVGSGAQSKPLTEEVAPDAVQKALLDYRLATRLAYNNRRFDELDQNADQARASKEKFGNGSWKLWQFYDSLGCADSEPESMWQLHDRIHKDWIAGRPGSVTAQVARVGFLFEYAWHARGTGVAGTVTPAMWQLFGERLKVAHQALLDCREQGQTCPVWWSLGMRLAIGEQWPRADADRIYSQAKDFEPTFWNFDVLRSRYLSLKWYGQPGDWEAARALSGETVRVNEAYSPDGQDRIYWDVRYTPLHNSVGRLIGGVHRAIDISDKIKRAPHSRYDPSSAQIQEADALRVEVAAHRSTLIQLTAIKQELEDKVERQLKALNHSNERFKIALRGTGVLVFEQDAELTFTWTENIDPAIEAANGGSLVGLNDYSDVKSSAESLALKEQVLASGESVQAYTEHKVGDQTLHFQVSMSPTKLEDGRRGLVGAATNITALKEHERHLETVMRELTHRSKNLLAVVQSIAVQTARSAGSVPDFNATFGPRLMALANAHDLIAHGQWHGASIFDLAKRQLLHLITSYPGRIRMSGPPVILEPEVAQYVGLALHELGTNAVKYGALACDDGVVTVKWSYEYKHLKLEWCETGSIPAPKGEPRKGFGRMLLETVVPKAAKGFAELTFSPGLCWRLSA